MLIGSTKACRGEQPEFQAKRVRMGVAPDVMPTAVLDRQIAAEPPKWERIAAMNGASQK